MKAYRKWLVVLGGRRKAVEILVTTRRMRLALYLVARTDEDKLGDGKGVPHLAGKFIGRVPLTVGENGKKSPCTGRLG